MARPLARAGGAARQSDRPAKAETVALVCTYMSIYVHFIYENVMFVNFGTHIRQFIPLGGPVVVGEK